MKNYILKIFSVVILLFSRSLAQDLEIFITLDKSEYLQYEMIKSVAELKNISSKEIKIQKPFLLEASGSGLEVRLFDSNNNRIQSKGHTILNVAMLKNIILQPGESLITFIHLTQLGFGKEIPGGGLSILEDNYLSPGRYKMQLKYNYGSNENEFYSNTVEFFVKQPSENDLKIFSEIQNIRNEEYTLSENEYVNKLNEVINKYPYHKYILSAYYGLLLIHKTKESIKKEKLLKIINDHPSSIISFIALVDCPGIDDDFRKSAEIQLKMKSEKNKEIIKKYYRYKTIILKQN